MLDIELVSTFTSHIRASQLGLGIHQQQICNLIKLVTFLTIFAFHFVSFRYSFLFLKLRKHPTLKYSWLDRE